MDMGKRTRKADPFQEALQRLIETEAIVGARMAEAERTMIETRKELVEIDRERVREERRANKERNYLMKKIKEADEKWDFVLALLSRLPEAVREQMGFVPPKPT